MSDVKVLNTSLQSPVELVDNQQQSLKSSVQEALQGYFSKIGDTLVHDLYQMVLAEVEEPLLKAIMHYTRGNQSKAAIFLGLSRGTLRKKLKNYGLLD